MQFTSTQVMVQDLVEGRTSALLTMPTVTITPTPTLAAITLFQVEYKTRKQSWLGLTNSHLMRWRCFILVKSQCGAILKKNYIPHVRIALYNLYHDDGGMPKETGLLHTPSLIVFAKKIIKK